MKLKKEPEDFRVDELARWDEDPKGSFGVYRLRKRKLTTFEAVRMIAARTKVPLDRISYIGLKDKQAVTSQHISIEGPRVQGNIPGLHLEPLGRSNEELSGKNLLGNEFTIVVRDLSRLDAEQLVQRIASVRRHGLANYFDDQRFGSVKAGQGFPAKDLVLGKPEDALRKLIAFPTPHDPVPEKKFKFLITRLWGDWQQIARKFGPRHGASMVRHLAKKPDDYLGAFQRMPAKERAIHVFAYQSFIWNESLSRFLLATLPRQNVLRAETVAGRIVFWDYPAGQDMPKLPESFPLVSHESKLEDPRVLQAVKETLGQEKLSLEKFKIEGIPGAFFKHEERPLVLRPERLQVPTSPVPDDRGYGRFKLTVSFRLGPGSYATLVLKRLLESRPLAAPYQPPRPHKGPPRPERRPHDHRGGRKGRR
jgi:tRNA pseudouridine13 synthase